jgi:hypothetical protein
MKNSLLKETIIDIIIGEIFVVGICFLLPVYLLNR